MADSGISVTFDQETSQHLIKLARATKQSVQKLTEKLVKEAIELEAEDIAFSKIIRYRLASQQENYKNCLIA
ncbi:MAG: hypothetical protein LKM45_06560 [Wolbachia endosymbiont of Alcedoecus sp.]|nr:hypothetical protein [Wolbachia endosymbiont of Alcedoecus sp.]